MGHFAKVENGIVKEVIVADQQFIDSGVVGHNWIKTSYNTYGNVHYAPSPPNPPRTPDGEPPLRGNFAQPGYIYDTENDVFYEPKPYPSWTLNTTSWLWEAPIPKPNDGEAHYWIEEEQKWVP